MTHWRVTSWWFNLDYYFCKVFYLVWINFHVDLSSQTTVLKFLHRFNFVNQRIWRTSRGFIFAKEELGNLFLNKVLQFKLRRSLIHVKRWWGIYHFNFCYNIGFQFLLQYRTSRSIQLLSVDPHVSCNFSYFCNTFLKTHPSNKLST